MNELDLSAAERARRSASTTATAAVRHAPTLTCRWEPQGDSTMMIPERPALERRVLDALDVTAGGAGATRADSRSCSAGAARAARRCCCGCATCSAATPRSTSTSSASPRRPSASSPRCASPRRSRHTRRPPSAATTTVRASRSTAALAFLGQARGTDRRSGHLPARRIPRAAHLRKLPGPALGAARSDRRARRRATTASC